MANDFISRFELHIPYEVAVIYSIIFSIYLFVWFGIIVSGLIRWEQKNNLFAVTEKDKGRKKKRMRLWLTVILLALLLGLIIIMEGIG